MAIDRKDMNVSLLQRLRSGVGHMRELRGQAAEKIEELEAYVRELELELKEADVHERADAYDK